MRLFFPIAILASMAACTRGPVGFHNQDISQVNWGGDFTLTAHTGETKSLADFNGKVVLLFFGYTHCPDICAPTLAKLAQVTKQLKERARDVQVIFVTVDPAHDTAAQLAGFIPRFDPRFIGMTGTSAQIAAVAADYKVAYQPGKNTGSVDHTGSVFIKDRRGKLRLYAREDASVESIVADVERLLAEK